jgi:hypothetical protein
MRWRNIGEDDLFCSHDEPSLPSTGRDTVRKEEPGVNPPGAIDPTGGQNLKVEHYVFCALGYSLEHPLGGLVERRVSQPIPATDEVTVREEPGSGNLGSLGTGAMDSGKPHRQNKREKQQ